MPIVNLETKLFGLSCPITLLFVLHQTVSYLSYLHDCKITSHITCSFRAVKQFCNIITGPYLLIEISTL